MNASVPTIHSLDLHRPLPAAGVFALAADGHDLSVIAKALDVRCAVVKGYIEHFARDLLTRHRLVLPAHKRPLHSLSSYIVSLIEAADPSWTVALTASEQVAVIESRAYFRAFENRFISVEN